MTETETLVATLREQGERRLASFTSEELVAVGADSPLPGLVLSDRLATMAEAPLAAALAAALRGLVAREFLRSGEALGGPAGGATGSGQLARALDALGSGDRPADEVTAELSLPLRGDLALVVALRRSPALVARLSEPSPLDLARRGALAHRRTNALLHGFTSDREGLVGILEERRSLLGVHAFVLRSLEQECQTLCASLRARAQAPLDTGALGACETALEVSLPGEPARPATGVLLRLGTDERGAQVASISWSVAPGVATTEQLAVSALDKRLGELLATIWRNGREGTQVAAS